MQHNKCRGDANRNNVPMANKCLFADVSFFIVGEGTKATFPFFAAENGGIDASSALLGEIIASLLPACECCGVVSRVLASLQ